MSWRVELKSKTFHSTHLVRQISLICSLRSRFRHRAQCILVTPPRQGSIPSESQDGPNRCSLPLRQYNRRFEPCRRAFYRVCSQYPAKFYCPLPADRILASPPKPGITWDPSTASSYHQAQAVRQLLASPILLCWFSSAASDMRWVSKIFCTIFRSTKVTPCAIFLTEWASLGYMTMCNVLIRLIETESSTKTSSDVPWVWQLPYACKIAGCLSLENRGQCLSVVGCPTGMCTKWIAWKLRRVQVKSKIWRCA